MRCWPSRTRRSDRGSSSGTTSSFTTTTEQDRPGKVSEPCRCLGWSSDDRHGPQRGGHMTEKRCTCFNMAADPACTEHPPGSPEGAQPGAGHRRHAGAHRPGRSSPAEGRGSLGADERDPVSLALIEAFPGCEFTATEPHPNDPPHAPLKSRLWVEDAETGEVTEYRFPRERVGVAEAVRGIGRGRADGVHADGGRAHDLRSTGG